MLLVKSGGEAAMAEWRAAFAAAAPGLDVRWWDDRTVDPASVRYVLCWAPEPGRLAALPGLRLICSAGAGVDHITADPAWPRQVPLVRMGGEEQARQMAEYVATAALFILRGMRATTARQAARAWVDAAAPRLAREVRAGVMGMGNLGSAAAALLRDIGFLTAGWSRTAKSIAGIESFAGPAALPAFLQRTDLLVCLLPHTRETAGLLDAARLRMLPAGASLINAGRGAHVVLPDLLAALDSGHLGEAVLDVFDTEPLPPEHPAWSHERITVTPHMACLPSRRVRAGLVAEAIAALERGGTLPNLFDPERGY